MPGISSLQIDKSSSNFHDFYVEDYTVFIRCDVTITNSGKDDATFELYANFPDDVELGLLKEERLQAYSENDGNSTQFEIDAAEIRVFSVLFVGEYGGTYLKHDRNLPEIEIVVKKPEIMEGESVDTYDLSTSEPGVETSKTEKHDLAWAKAEFEKRSFSPDVVYPISHVLLRYIESSGTCEFVLHGFYGAEFGSEGNADPLNYIMINSIEIRALSGGFYQLIDELSTNLSPSFENYGFAFGDWNADGVIDISLQLFEGGSMRYAPSLFWLWDGEQAKFVENEHTE